MLPSPAGRPFGAAVAPGLQARPPLLILRTRRRLDDFTAEVESHLQMQSERLQAATFLGVVVTRIGVAALACYVPARHAAHLDPMTAIRYE